MVEQFFAFGYFDWIQCSSHSFQCSVPHPPISDLSVDSAVLRDHSGYTFVVVVSKSGWLPLLDNFSLLSCLHHPIQFNHFENSLAFINNVGFFICKLPFRDGSMFCYDCEFHGDFTQSSQGFLFLTNLGALRLPLSESFRELNEMVLVVLSVDNLNKSGALFGQQICFSPFFG